MTSLSVRAATWNVLLQGDEYDPEYGQPLSIKLCAGREDACTLTRWERVWSVIEEKASAVDVLLLQEITDTFLGLQPVDSSWTLVRRSGECGVLMSGRSNFTVTTTFDVAMPGLSGCPAVPMVLLDDAFAIGSVHVRASVTNRTAWYSSAVQALTGALSGASPTRALLGGDFNHNLTEVGATFTLPTSWTLAYDPNIQPILGTSQKEYNYMGMFDGFFLSPAIVPFNPKAMVRGFMPKVVQGLPQNGQIQEYAQFNFSSNQLFFSASSNFAASMGVVVPRSHPLNEALSDHLLVAATFATPKPRTVRYVVYNGATDAFFATLVDGVTVSHPPCAINIEAVVPRVTGSVVTIQLLSIGKRIVTARGEREAPYFLFGDSGGDVFSGRIAAGSYSLRTIVDGVTSSAINFTLQGTCSS